MPNLPPQLVEAVEKLLALRPINRRVREIGQLLPFYEDAPILSKAAEVLARSSRPEYPHSAYARHGTNRPFKGLPHPERTGTDSVYTTPVGTAASGYLRNWNMSMDDPQANPRVYDMMMMAKDVHVPEGWASGHREPGVAQLFEHGGNRNKGYPYPVYVTNSSDMLVPRNSPEGRVREVLQSLLSHADARYAPYDRRFPTEVNQAAAEEVVGGLLGLAPSKPKMKKVDPVKMAKHDSIYTQDPEDGGYDYTSDHAFEAEQTVNVAGGQRGMKEKADQLRKLGRNEEAMILEQQLTSDQPFPSSLFKNPPPLGKGPLGGIKLQDLVRAMRLTRDYFRYIAPPKTSPPVGTNGMPMVWDGVAGLWRTAEEKPNMVWNSRKGAYEEDIPF